MVDFHWHLQWLEIYIALSEQQPVSSSNRGFSSVREKLLQLKEGDLETFLQIFENTNEIVRIHGVYTFLAFLKECPPLQRIGILKALQATPPSRYLPAFQDLQRRWRGESQPANSSQKSKTPFSSTCREFPLSRGCVCWMSIESFWVLKLLPWFPIPKDDP